MEIFSFNGSCRRCRCVQDVSYHVPEDSILYLVKLGWFLSSMYIPVLFYHVPSIYGIVTNLLLPALTVDNSFCLKLRPEQVLCLSESRGNRQF